MATVTCPDCGSVLQDRECQRGETRAFFHRVHAHGYDGAPPGRAPRTQHLDPAEVDALLDELAKLIDEARARRATQLTLTFTAGIDGAADG